MTLLNVVGVAMMVAPLAAVAIAFTKGIPKSTRNELVRVAGAVAYWALAVFLVLR